MRANLDRFHGAEPATATEVGSCEGCGGCMYSYEVTTCESCGSTVHIGCTQKCDGCGEEGCRACLKLDKDTGWRLCAVCREKEAAFKAGFDSGTNGANTENCHFRFFATEQLRNSWERGASEAQKVS